MTSLYIIGALTGLTTGLAGFILGAYMGYEFAKKTIFVDMERVSRDVERTKLRREKKNRDAAVYVPPMNDQEMLDSEHNSVGRIKNLVEPSASQREAEENHE